jgi:hypothetical protein
MGPIEMIPAVPVRRTPLTPPRFPRNSAMCGGFKKKFKKTMRLKTRHSGRRMLRKTLKLLPRAKEALSGTKIKRIP